MHRSIEVQSSDVLQDITALILAGGQGVRMGGVDKGLQDLHGQPLVAWVVNRLASQAGALVISANRNAEHYAKFGYPVIPDNPLSTWGHFQGPLAGIHAALEYINSTWLLTAPCDVPEIPANLTRRLFDAVQKKHCMLAVATSSGQCQPLISILHRDLLPSLKCYLDSGRRSVWGWQQTLSYVEVEFQTCEFANLNSQEDLRACKLRW